MHAGSKALIFLLILFPCISQADTNHLVFTDYMVELTMPKEWLQLPPDAIETLKSRNLPPEQARQLNLVAAFTRSANHAFWLPYIIVQMIPTGASGLPTIEMFNKTFASLGLNVRSLPYLKMTSGNLDAGTVLVDDFQRRYVYLLDGRDLGGAPMKVLVYGTFLPSGYILQLNCYSDGKNLMQDAQDFLRVGKSVSPIIAKN
jgi:hypothetical protein